MSTGGATVKCKFGALDLVLEPDLNNPIEGAIQDQLYSSDDTSLNNAFQNCTSFSSSFSSNKQHFSFSFW